jgi:hypothetical protein
MGKIIDTNTNSYPRHSWGSFLCGQSPVLPAAPQGTQGFLTLATILPLPAKALLGSWKLPMFALEPKRKDCGKDSACIFGYRESFFELPTQPGVFVIQKENPRNTEFLRFVSSLKYSLDYLFENCGARRAALRPYFLRSFILGSRVRNPAFFKGVRKFSESYWSRALAIP